MKLSERIETGEIEFCVGKDNSFAFSVDDIATAEALRLIKMGEQQEQEIATLRRQLEEEKLISYKYNQVGEEWYRTAMDWYGLAKAAVTIYFSDPWEVIAVDMDRVMKRLRMEIEIQEADKHE